MPKDLTVKDVFYALEYLNDQMIRTPIRDGKAVWSMKIGGQTVRPSIAQEVCTSGSVSSFEDRGRAIVVWARAA